LHFLKAAEAQRILPLLQQVQQPCKIRGQQIQAYFSRSEFKVKNWLVFQGSADLPAPKFEEAFCSFKAYHRTPEGARNSRKPLF